MMQLIINILSVVFVGGTSASIIDARVRLVGGNGTGTGLIEVEHAAHWCYICGDAWTYLKAVAVCRDLGFGAAEQAYVVNDTQAGTSVMHVAECNCEGDNKFLQNCNITSLTTSTTCGKVAGVVCSNPTTDVRLVGGSGPHEGRVEVLINGTWGTICGKSWWSKDGLVVCHQLGYLYLDSPYEKDGFGEGNGPILLTEMKCSRTNTRLLECEHIIVMLNESCSMNRNAMAVCSNKTIGVRLTDPMTGSVSELTGIVEIQYNGTWGVVGTNRKWDEHGGQKVCEEFGYLYLNHSSVIFRSESSKTMWLKWIKCYDGKAESFRTCLNSGLREHGICNSNTNCTVAYVECAASSSSNAMSSYAADTTPRESASTETFILVPERHTQAPCNSACKLQSIVSNTERKLFQEIIGDSVSITSDDYVGMALKVSSDNESQEYSLHTDDGDVMFQPINLQLGNATMVIVALFFTNSFGLTEEVSNIKDSLKVGEDIHDTGNISYTFLSTGLFSLSLFNMHEEKCNLSVSFQLPTHEVTMSKTEQSSQEFICVYLADAGLWSDTGCVSRDEDSCYCTHTTSYAILMKTTSGKVEEDNTHHLILSWISRASMGISLSGLLATLITYSCFKKLRQSTRSIIHCNFTANIILLQTLFLFGINRTGNEYMCMVVAIGLHITALTTFTWMLAEAVFIAFKVLLTTPSTYNDIKYYLKVCYGIPVVIVGLTFAIRFSVYRDRYICWLNNEYGLRWAFMSPAIAIILINGVILGMIVRCIFVRSAFNTSPHTDTSGIKKSVKGAVILMPLFGITWIIGPFILGSASIAMEYLFCIINGLQGFFIFLIYVVFDKEASSIWKNRIKRSNTISSSTEMQTAPTLVQTGHTT